jgi:ADP-ribose pyrophosphatase
MMEILVEEQTDFPQGLLVANFDFIDAAREQSATHGVHSWFASEYRIIPRQVFGTDVIPNIDKHWMYPEWVKKKASKLFVPRGDSPVDYRGLDNYCIMPFRARDELMILSSSLIREQIPEGDFTGLSEGVAEYIQRHGLYLPQTNRSMVSMHVNHQKPLHIKSRTQKPGDYPERFHVPDDKVSWDFTFPEYSSEKFTHENVLRQFATKWIQGWADNPDVPSNLDTVFQSYEWMVRRDEQGRPMNPRGRTGISDRGILGKWGANFAADPLVTRNNPETGQLELLVIKRWDTGEWAIPGGMVDYWEYGSAAAKRELKEEAGLDIDFSQAPIVYQGYVDDPRNTDNAWMETTAVHVHLTDEQVGIMEPEAGDDAIDFDWMPLVDEKIKTLYASHSELVRAMLRHRKA